MLFVRENRFLAIPSVMSSRATSSRSPVETTSKVRYRSDTRLVMEMDCDLWKRIIARDMRLLTRLLICRFPHEAGWYVSQRTDIRRDPRP